MPAFIALARANWQYIVMALLVAALYVSNNLRKDAKHDLELLIANNKTAVAEKKADQAKHDLDDVKFNTAQKEKFDVQKTALLTTIDGVSRELRDAQQKLGSGARSQPIRVDAKFCSQPDADRRLSGSLQKAFGDIDEITKRTADGAIANQIGIGASIVAPAGTKQIEATELREFVIRGNQVNAPRSP